MSDLYPYLSDQIHKTINDAANAAGTANKKNVEDASKAILALIAGLSGGSFFGGGNFGNAFANIIKNEVTDALGNVLGTDSLHITLSNIAQAAVGTGGDPLQAVSSIIGLKQGNFRQIFDSVTQAAGIGSISDIMSGAIQQVISNIPAAANFPIVLPDGRQILFDGINDKIMEKVITDGVATLQNIPIPEANEIINKFIDNGSLTAAVNEFGVTVLQIIPSQLDEFHDFPVSEDDSTIVDDDGVEIKSSGATIIDLAINEAISLQKENPDVPIVITDAFKILSSTGKEIAIPNLQLPAAIKSEAEKASEAVLATKILQAATGAGGSAGFGQVLSAVGAATGLPTSVGQLQNFAAANIAGMLQQMLVGRPSGGAKRVPNGDVAPEGTIIWKEEDYDPGENDKLDQKGGHTATV